MGVVAQGRSAGVPLRKRIPTRPPQHMRLLLKGRKGRPLPLPALRLLLRPAPPATTVTVQAETMATLIGEALWEEISAKAPSQVHRFRMRPIGKSADECGSSSKSRPRRRGRRQGRQLRRVLR